MPRKARELSPMEVRCLSSRAAVAAPYIAQHVSSWKSAKHEAQRTATLRTYAEPIIGTMLARDVTTANVIKVLEPIWQSQTGTATRVRSRIELVLDFATARGLREGPNPARWRGNLEAALPRPNKLARVKHHRAVAVGDITRFYARLREQAGMGARALGFALLTAARSGEVRGAVWSEIELQTGLWTVPEGRMKSGREHRVPLSQSAVSLLQSLSKNEPGDLVFPGLRIPLSDMSLTAVLRRMRVNVTVHGFRSTFRDGCSEHTCPTSEVAEMALAHAVGNKVEAAYRRGDLFDKRMHLKGSQGECKRIQCMH